MIHRMAPPHALIETDSSYSIIFNMLGVAPEDVGIEVDERRGELTVVAKRNIRYGKRGFFWVFAMPEDGNAANVTTRFESGVVEVLIPKAPARVAIPA